LVVVGAVVAAVLVAAVAVELVLVALVAEIALVAVSLPVVLVDVGSELPCCPAAWNSAPRNCCRAAATEVADDEVLEVASVAGVEVVLEFEVVEDVSLDGVNPSCDNVAAIACASGFVPLALPVDVIDEESALFPSRWLARVRLTAHGSALAADPVSAEMDMHCSEWLA